MAQPPAIRHRTLIDRAMALPRWLWRELIEIAEMFSDVGHGPRRWRESSPVQDPYAGSGPDAPPGTLNDDAPAGTRTSEE
ncbi:MAG: hypothetical protein AB1736_09130 [Chloroflexota bacterium]